MKFRRLIVALLTVMLFAAITTMTSSTATAAASGGSSTTAKQSHVKTPSPSYTEVKNQDGTTSETYSSGPIPVSQKQPKEPRPSKADINAAQHGTSPNDGLMHADAGWYGPWGPGCYWTYTYMADKNGFGGVMRESWIIVNNWCFGPSPWGWLISSTPWARFQSAGHLGWTDCGWGDPWQGWIRQGYEWAAGGTAYYGFGGKCAFSWWPHTQFLHVYENGYRYTS